MEGVDLSIGQHVQLEWHIRNVTTGLKAVQGRSLSSALRVSPHAALESNLILNILSEFANLSCTLNQPILHFGVCDALTLRPSLKGSYIPTHLETPVSFKRPSLTTSKRNSSDFMELITTKFSTHRFHIEEDVESSLRRPFGQQHCCSS